MAKNAIRYLVLVLFLVNSISINAQKDIDLKIIREIVTRYDENNNAIKDSIKWRNLSGLITLSNNEGLNYLTFFIPKEEYEKYILRSDIVVFSSQTGHSSISSFVLPDKEDDKFYTLNLKNLSNSKKSQCILAYHSISETNEIIYSISFMIYKSESVYDTERTFLLKVLH